MIGIEMIGISIEILRRRGYDRFAFNHLPVGHIHSWTEIIISCGRHQNVA